MTVNFNNIKDSLDIRISDFAGNLRLVRLDANPECRFTHATYHISDKYILAQSQEGLFQFDSEGRFIRLLVRKGTGPDEFTQAEVVFDENQNKVILADFRKQNYYMCFDLATGSRLENIPKAVHGTTRKLALTGENILASVTDVRPNSKSDRYYIYWQDIEGLFIDGIKGPAGLTIPRNTRFYYIDNEYRYQLAGQDTVYSIIDKKIIPYLVFNYGENAPVTPNAPGYQKINQVTETRRYIFLGGYRIADSAEAGNQPGSSVELVDYCLDKDNKQAYLISAIENDFMGAMENPNRISFQSNGIIWIQYYPDELIEVAERTIGNPAAGPEVIERMKQVRQGTSSENNPILLVAKRF